MRRRAPRSRPPPDAAGEEAIGRSGGPAVSQRHADGSLRLPGHADSRIQLRRRVRWRRPRRGLRRGDVAQRAGLLVDDDDAVVVLDPVLLAAAADVRRGRAADPARWRRRRHGAPARNRLACKSTSRNVVCTRSSAAAASRTRCRARRHRSGATRSKTAASASRSSAIRQRSKSASGGPGCMHGSYREAAKRHRPAAFPSRHAFVCMPPRRRTARTTVRA